MKWTTCSGRRLLALFGGVFLFGLLTRYYSHLERSAPGDGLVRAQGPLLDTPGCHIPDLDPFDPAVAAMLFARPPLECAAPRPPLVRVRDDRGSLEVVESSLKAYAVTDRARLRCCYRELRGQQVAEVGSMEYPVSYSNSCVPFSLDGAATMGAEFVRVQCRLGSKKIYVDFFAFTPLKPLVEQRCQAKDPEFLERDWLSVLILGIDSVSRINFHRQMARTNNVLHGLGAVEMLGYNKVGDNTYPNLLATLTGLSVHEARDSCWSAGSPWFDSCPFTWTNFSRAGFRTAFAEDDAHIGTFNYNGRCGFLRPPTDFYLRPFHVTFNKARGSGQEDHDGKLCLGSKANVDVLLDYAKDFATTMSSRRSFGLFWQSTVTHDALNDAQQLDERLASTLTQLSSTGALNHTLLVVMSDHGLRYGPIRTTMHGWLEERLPLLTLTFPSWFRAGYPRAVANVRANAQRLTTPFDVHRTLTDLLDLKALGDAQLEGRDEGERRGRSLFVPVPDVRTCDDAGIPAHWCTCRRVERVKVDDEMRSAAGFVVGALNRWLRAFPQCARLEVRKVVSATRRFVSGGDSGPDAGSPGPDGEGPVPDVVDFVLVLETAPGGALFEATMRRGEGGWEFAKGDALDVSRVNLYGTQSWCVNDTQARLYCFCLAPKGL